MLWGGGQQSGALDGLLAEVRAGYSRVLVVSGEPGIGKTALLGYAAQAAPDFQLARAEGVESEMELPFAALQQLCGRMLGRLGMLPGPQRDALGVAFGLCAGGAPDRFLVGLAGLPGRGVAGRAEADARALLAAVLPGRLDERVRDRIIAESGGNPLALLELPLGVTAAELAGGFGVAGPLPLASRIEDSFRRRVAPLPELTRRLLLRPAAEPPRHPPLLLRTPPPLALPHDTPAP